MRKTNVPNKSQSFRKDSTGGGFVLSKTKLRFPNNTSFRIDSDFVEHVKLLIVKLKCINSLGT